MRTLSPNSIKTIWQIEGVHGVRMKGKQITAVNLQRAIDIIEHMGNDIEDLIALRDMWFPNYKINRKAITVGQRKQFKVGANGTVMIPVTPYNHGDTVQVYYDDDAPVVIV